jgi:hypothetical protein
VKIELNIPDDLYERLVSRSKAGKHEQLKINNHIRKVLQDFVDVGRDGTRYFIVEGDMRRQLEKVFQTTIETPDQLVRKVQNLSRVGIGNVERPLTDGESIQMEEQANFWGQTPAEFIKTTMERVLDETLNRV